LTPRIEPLVQEWRRIAADEKKAVGLGGEWAGEEPKDARSQGHLARGREEELRIRITEVLQRGVEELGRSVEEKEGRFEREEWSQSTSRLREL
jgi:monolysocardiolipin acyltransferase